MARRCQYVLRHSLGENAPAFEHHHPLSDCEGFFGEWVTYRIGISWAAFHARRSSRIFDLVALSSAVSGSSSSNAAGFVTSERASATR